MGGVFGRLGKRIPSWSILGIQEEEKRGFTDTEEPAIRGTCIRWNLTHCCNGGPRAEWSGQARKGAPRAAGRGQAFPGKWLLSWFPKGKGKRAGPERWGGKKLQDRKLVLESEAS